MAQTQINTDLLMPNESKLAKAEASRYIDQQKTAKLYTKIADYMFWGATSLILPVVGIATTIIKVPAVLAIAGLSVSSGALLAVGAVASVATFAGSLFFSSKATDLSEKSNVLYSDIDSQNQARRMVQAFARAQSQSADTGQSTKTLFTSDASDKTWIDRTQAKQASLNDRWQDKITAQANREDALALEQFTR